MSRLFVSDFNFSSSEDEDEGNNKYDDPDIAAKYKKQRRERRQMKRDAVADLMRLQKIVNGMEEGEVGGGGERRGSGGERERRFTRTDPVTSRKSAVKEAKDRENQRTKRIVEEARRRREEDEKKEKRREERERRRRERENKREREGEKEKSKRGSNGNPPRPNMTMSHRGNRSPAKKNRVNNPVFDPAKKTVRRHSSIPSRYIGKTPDSPPKNSTNTSDVLLRPEWCNSKGPNRHTKHNTKHPNMADIGSVLEDIFDDGMFGDLKEIRRKKKVTGHVNPAKHTFTRGANNSKDSDEEENSKPDFPPASDSSAPEKDKKTYTSNRVFESRAEREERERRSRLEANRKALGLDGGGTYSERRDRQKKKDKKPEREENSSNKERKGYGKDGDYSAFVKEEMRKFKERAEAERQTARMDDLLLRDYNMSWEGFVRSETNNCIRERDIPWLPRLRLSGPGGKESWKLVGVSEHADFELKKAALRVHTMRWHPDKFSQKWGSRIRAEEKEEVMERVRECCQRLNEIRGRLEVERT